MSQGLEDRLEDRLEAIWRSGCSFSHCIQPSFFHHLVNTNPAEGPRERGTPRGTPRWTQTWRGKGGLAGGQLMYDTDALRQGRRGSSVWAGLAQQVPGETNTVEGKGEACHAGGQHGGAAGARMHGWPVMGSKEHRRRRG